MARKIIIGIFFLWGFGLIKAQNTTDSLGWKTSGNLGLSFTQVALSNWSGGGKSTIALTGLVGLGAEYLGEIQSWENSVDLGYGMTKLGKEDFRKSDDKMILVSKYGYKANSVLDYSALLDFRTQFNYGYNFDKLDSNNEYKKISAFMSPAYLNIGIGLNYKPVEYFQIMLSPLANRLIVVLDDDLSRQGAFGVDSNKNFKSELGSALNFTFKKDVAENVNLQTRLNLFSAYESFPKTVVNWEVTINMKINSFLTASLATDLIYDDKIKMTRANGTVGPATQFRNVLAIGFAYKL